MGRPALKHAVTVLVLLTVVSALTPAVALDAEDTPRVGLVLSGGGARGLAHVGVIKALEELQVPVHSVSGTSMGALVGGFYAAGMNAPELEAIVARMDWEQAFRDTPLRGELPQPRKLEDYDFPGSVKLQFTRNSLYAPLGLIEGQQARHLIEDLLEDASAIDDFDQLPRPFRAVATDIETGQAAIMQSGDLATAMRASMSIPGLLAPVEIDGKLLVDRGVSMNIPVQPAIDMALDRLLVVDIGGHLTSQQDITNLVGVADQMVKIMTRRTSLQQLALLTDADIVISPEASQFSILDFADSAMIVQLGYDATMAMAASLAPLRLNKEAWQAYLAGIQPPVQERPEIAFIEVNDASPLSDEIIRKQVSQQVGTPLDQDQLSDDIETIYALGHWHAVDSSVVEDERGVGIVIETQYDPRQQSTLKFGLSVLSEVNEQAQFTAGASYTRRDLNALAGEFFADIQLGSDSSLSLNFYQPLDHGSNLFLRPRAYYTDRSVDSLGVEFDFENTFGRWRVRQSTAELPLGLDLGQAARLEGGLFRTWGDFDINRIGTIELEDANFDEGGWFTRFTYDTLDDLYFPTDGAFIYADYQQHTTGMGADTRFERARLNSQWAHSFGSDNRNTMLLTARAHLHWDAELLPQNLYQLGGLFNFSALPYRALSGRQLGFFMAQYQRRLSQGSVLPFSIPLYVGASLEYGWLWADTSEMSIGDLEPAASLYLGARTPLGPVYFGYGRGKDSVDSYFLSIAWPFAFEGIRPLR